MKPRVWPWAPGPRVEAREGLLSVVVVAAAAEGLADVLSSNRAQVVSYS